MLGIANIPICFFKRFNVLTVCLFSWVVMRFFLRAAVQSSVFSIKFIVLDSHHGRQSWGGWGGYIPPWFWEGGDDQCFHSPLEMNEAQTH